MAYENPWQFWAEENWPAAYGGFLQKQKGTPSFLDYWKGQQGNVWNQYMGQLGQMALGGQAPSLNFTDYLEDYPWLKNWQALSPSQRGEYPSQYMSSLRWML